MTPELILHNGRIYTVDERRPWAEAAAVTGGRFVAVGSNADVLALAGPETERIDLQGRLALPGLCDAHIHFYDWSLARQQVLLAGCRSKEEMGRLISLWAAAHPQGWIIGRGWNEGLWSDPALPTRDDLDPLTGDRPAIFWRSDMHAAVVNSAALAAAGISEETADPDGGLIGRDAAGRPNGLLWELAINKVMTQMPAPEQPALDQALLDGMAQLHRLGVTAVHDQRMKDQDEGPRALAAYQRLQEQEQLHLRLNCNIAAHDLPYLAGLGLRSGFGSDYLRLGHIKLFTDGTMGSRTAWMLEPFVKEAPDAADNYGVPLTPLPQMAEEFRQAAALGFSISVHAIGDRANREVLDLFEELLQGQPRPPIPHRIEHVQIIHPNDLPRLAELGLTASVQPIHATDDMDTANLVLGPRAERVYSFAGLAASGARLALGSDAPVANPNPFLGFHAALYRQRPERMEQGPWYPEQRLSLEQTVRGYTLDAAAAAGWEDTIGSVSPGKRADLIVLDRDLFRLVEADEGEMAVAGTQVILTLFDGQVMVWNEA